MLMILFVYGRLSRREWRHTLSASRRLSRRALHTIIRTIYAKNILSIAARCTLAASTALVGLSEIPHLHLLSSASVHVKEIV